MLWFPVPGWRIWPGGGYLIISRDVHLVRRGQVLECRRELMLGFRVRGWQICASGGYFIICREVRLLRGGHVLECRRDILQQQQAHQRRQDVG